MQNYLLKNLLLISLVISMSFGFVDIVEAFSIEPESGTINGSQTFEILADNTTSNAVDVDLSVTGMTIISFTPGDNITISTGFCNAENDSFTNDQICVGLGKQSNFISGEVIGSFETEISPNLSSATISIEGESIYSDTTRPEAGQIGSYTISGSAQIVTPTPTSIISNGDSSGSGDNGGISVLPQTATSTAIWVLVGFAVIGAGVFLKNRTKKS